MLNQNLIRYFSAMSFSLLLLIRSGYTEDFSAAPAPLQAALFLKLLAFNKNISTGGSITMYIIGASDFAAEMKKAEGKPVGMAKFAKNLEGSDVPSEKPSVIYVGDAGLLPDILTYTKKNKILSISGNPDLVSKGVALGVVISEGKPKIILNLSTTKDEGIEWNPAIFKVAATIK